MKRDDIDIVYTSIKKCLDKYDYERGEKYARIYLKECIARAFLKLVEKYSDRYGIRAVYVEDIVGGERLNFDYTGRDIDILVICDEEYTEECREFLHKLREKIEKIAFSIPDIREVLGQHELIEIHCNDFYAYSIHNRAFLHSLE